MLDTTTLQTEQNCGRILTMWRSAACHLSNQAAVSLVGGIMKLSKSVALVLVMTALVSASCSKTPVKPSSSAGALTANSAVENVGPRPFERHMLTSSGFHTMNEFILPEIRSRMDEEPVGDSDTNDPVPVEPGAASDEPVAEASPAEAPAAEEQTGQA